MNWDGKRVVVTGAGGFIGSHLVERLVRLGASTRAFVRYNSRSAAGALDQSELLSSIEVISGDVRDADSLTRAIRGADTVFHLAALIGIPYSYEAPTSYVRTNVEGTLNVLQACREAAVSRVVTTSTSEVYGSARRVPIDENHPLQGQSPYSASKIGADKLSESFFLSFGLPVAVIRPFNTYGPRQSARAIIPTIITQLLAGGTVQLGSLVPTRDFTFVEDTVTGFLGVATTPEALGSVTNVGSGQEIAVGELANRIAVMLGKRLDVVEDKGRVRPSGSEVERLVADTSRAQRLFAWSPSVSLDQGLRMTSEWIERNLQFFGRNRYSI